MSSFDTINYSVRPNKCIQRALAFEGVRLLTEHLDVGDFLYLGLGSIWFMDFQKAHKDLRIRDMISVEGDDIGYARAKFNTPFKTVRVEHGLTTHILPKLLEDDALITRPWLVWLDYDGALSEDVVQDLQTLVERAPPNTVLLATFNAVGRSYGQPKQRADRLRALLGSVVPDDLTREACEDENFDATLADLTLQYMQSVAAGAARPGGFIPAFRLNYRDGASMATIGGILPAKGAVPAVKAVVASDQWPSLITEQIVTPPLTTKEVAVLQATLPRMSQLTRQDVQELGFDLDEKQAQAYERYYRYYPTYAQVVV